MGSLSLELHMGQARLSWRMGGAQSSSSARRNFSGSRRTGALRSAFADRTLAKHTDQSVQLLTGMFARDGEAKIPGRGATQVPNEGRENSGAQELALQLPDLLCVLRENGNDWTRGFSWREVRIAQCFSSINQVRGQTFSQAPIILQNRDAFQRRIGQR